MGVISRYNSSDVFQATYSSIQDAIDAASNGDSIRLTSDTYNEAGIWVNKAVTIEPEGADLSVEITGYNYAAAAGSGWVGSGLGNGLTAYEYAWAPTGAAFQSVTAFLPGAGGISQRLFSVSEADRKRLILGNIRLYLTRPQGDTGFNFGAMRVHLSSKYFCRWKIT